MALHGEGDGGRRTELAMFAPALPAPVALTDEPSRLLGARRLLRLTEPIADKQWRRHGPRKRRATRTPIGWWGEVQRLVDGIEPSRNEKGYWEFADVAGKRLLAVAGTRKARRS